MPSSLLWFTTTPPSPTFIGADIKVQGVWTSTPATEAALSSAGKGNFALDFPRRSVGVLQCAFGGYNIQGGRCKRRRPEISGHPNGRNLLCGSAATLSYQLPPETGWATLSRNTDFSVCLVPATVTTLLDSCTKSSAISPSVPGAMDFSWYGHASPEWLSFLEANPSAAQDGFDENHRDQAATLRSTSNETRSKASSKGIVEEHLDQEVEMATITIPSRHDHTIPLRTYRPKTVLEGEPLGVVLYFHGGGFLFGDETTDDLACCRIADKTRTVVVSVIYRHTDTHQHPAQINDAWDAFQHMRHHAITLNLPIDKGLIVMGISAGCTLGASVVLRELEESRKSEESRPIIMGILLAIPWLIHIDSYPMELFKSPGVSAKLQHADAPVIPAGRLNLFSSLLEADDVTDRLLNIPLLSGKELKGWPRTVLQIAGADPLRDDGLIFASKLEGTK